MFSLRSKRGGPPLLIGHRGASGEAPENTLVAFRLAVEQGADVVELDVQLTADGIPVVIHDPTVERTTDGSGLVNSLTLEQVKRLDAGRSFGALYPGARIPTLDEVLAWASGTVPLAIEIKNTPVRNPGIEEKVVEALQRHQMIEHSVVISFDHSSVLRTKEICPELAGGVLFAGSPVSPSTLASQARADVLLPHWSDVGEQMMRDARAHGLAVAAWVVDSEVEMEFALSLGLDALGTNYPGRLKALVDARWPT